MILTPEEQRQKIYLWLDKEFEPIEGRLDPEGRVELDGKLWKLSAILEQAKMWKALEMALEDQDKQRRT